MQPRIRTVKPEFFRHWGLYCLEKEIKLPIRLAFEGLWICSDREGRFPWRPEELKVVILPYDDVDFSRVLDALVTRAYLEKYSVNGQDFGVIPTFLKHQHINPRETKSHLPAPPQGLLFQHLDASPTRCDASGTRATGKGRERKGKEGFTPVPLNHEKNLTKAERIERQNAAVVEQFSSKRAG